MNKGLLIHRLERLEACDQAIDWVKTMPVPDNPHFENVVWQSCNYADWLVFVIPDKLLTPEVVYSIFAEAIAKAVALYDGDINEHLDHNAKIRYPKLMQYHKGEIDLSELNKITWWSAVNTDWPLSRAVKMPVAEHYTDEWVFKHNIHQFGALLAYWLYKIDMSAWSDDIMCDAIRSHIDLENVIYERGWDE